MPEYVCFLQDDPFYHCTDTVEIINNFSYDKKFYPLGITYKLGEWDVPKSENYASMLNIKYKHPIKFINSAQCIVHRDLIRKTPRILYQRIIRTINKTIKCDYNYCIEYLWPTILNFNEELEVSFYNCKGGGIA